MPLMSVMPVYVELICVNPFVGVIALVVRECRNGDSIHATIASGREIAVINAGTHGTRVHTEIVSRDA